MEVIGIHPGATRTNFSIDYSHEVKQKPVSPSVLRPGYKILSRPNEKPIIVKKHSPPATQTK